MDKGALWATVHGVARVGHDLVTKLHIHYLILNSVATKLHIHYLILNPHTGS